MSSREQILRRLQQAAPAQCDLELPAPRDESLFRDFPGDKQDLAELFSQRLVALKGEFHRAADEKAAAQVVSDVLKTCEEGPVAVQREPLIDRVMAQLPELARIAEKDAEPREMDSCDFAAYSVGISAADFLVARTGSVVLRSTHCGGRRLTVLPPLHLVIARTNQLVPSLDDALSVIGLDDLWSFATIATGPSRTADIEKTLVLGAHGPKRLVVVLCE